MAAAAQLQQLAHDGDVTACPSLAELLAFEGKWEEVIPNAARLIAAPDVVRAGNVFDDMVRLLGRAGHKTGKWKDIERLARDARGQIDSRAEKQQLRNRYHVILDRLSAYARGRGSISFLQRLADKRAGRMIPEHELIMLWKKPGDVPAAERRLQLHGATQNVSTHRPDLKGDPKGLSRHLFALAQSFDCPEEALTRFEADPEPIGFDGALYVARHLASQKRSDKAWEIIHSKLCEWAPVDPAQVAPVILLTDPVLERMMTKVRCEKVLYRSNGGGPSQGETKLEANKITEVLSQNLREGFCIVGTSGALSPPICQVEWVPQSDDDEDFHVEVHFEDGTTQSFKKGEHLKQICLERS